MKVILTLSLAFFLNCILPTIAFSMEMELTRGDTVGIVKDRIARERNADRRHIHVMINGQARDDSFVIEPGMTVHVLLNYYRRTVTPSAAKGSNGQGVP